MGNSNTVLTKTDPLMTDECWEARKKIQLSREKFIEQLQEECEHCDDCINLDEEVHHHQPEEDEHLCDIDSTQYEFPFENLVLEGGGAKGLAYCGVGRTLEEHGLMKQIHRFAGASIGAIGAALYSVGFNSYDVEKVMSVNLQNLVSDASCGYLSFIPNLLSNYGWNPGNKFLNYLGKVLASKTNNPDITFAEIYKKYGNELCIVVTNVNTMREEYCHVKTTPDMPVRVAVRMSMSIPGVFQAIKYKMLMDTNLYVDGGVICNYPLHCFDGWWLSMDPKDSFLQKVQPIKDIHNLLDQHNRFKADPGPSKTIGCLVFSASEREYFKVEVQKKSGVPRGELPNTKLARAWAKTQRGQEKLNNGYTKVSEAAFTFLEVLNKFNLEGNDMISKEEFKKAFAETHEARSNIKAAVIQELAFLEEYDPEYCKLLFGEDCDPVLAFKAVNRDGSGKISYNELMHYMEEVGVCIHEQYLGYKRTEVKGFLNFLTTIFSGLVLNVMRIFLRSSDVERTIGIHTWYIQANDFGMEDDDKKFIIDQGRRSTVKYLQNYAYDNKLNKVTDDVIKSREVPNGTTLTEEQLAQIFSI